MHFFVTVNLFRTKVLPEDNFCVCYQVETGPIFCEPDEDLAICRTWKAVASFLSLFLRPAPGIEPATYRSGVKCPTDWANPAVKETFGCILEIIESRSARHCPSNGISEDLWQPAIFRYFTTALIYKNTISEKSFQTTLAQWQSKKGRPDKGCKNHLIS